LFGGSSGELNRFVEDGGRGGGRKNGCTLAKVRRRRSRDRSSALDESILMEVWGAQWQPFRAAERSVSDEQ